MAKRILCLSLSMVVFLLTLIPTLALDISSDAVVLYDIENECILYEQESEERKPIASLTKLVAILVAIENIDNLQEEIIVDSEIIQGYSDYSKVGLRDGDVVTYEDLLYGMMLPSGADAALLIEYHVAGSQEAFADLMNKKVKELNLKNTHFDNPIGADSDYNYSTAKDMAILLNEALKNKTFYTMFTTKKYMIDHLNLEMESTLYYYNEYVDYDISSIEGSKTGFTNEAGYCLASLTHHDTQPVILIVLGADTQSKINALKDTLTIYDDFKSNYAYQEVLKQDQVIIELPIKLGWKKSYELKMPETLYGFVKDEKALDIQYEGIKELSRDIEKGDYIGKVSVYQNNLLLTSYDLVLQDQLYYHYPIAYLIIGGYCLWLFIFRKKRKAKRRKKR